MEQDDILKKIGAFEEGDGMGIFGEELRRSEAG